MRLGPFVTVLALVTGTVIAALPSTAHGVPPADRYAAPGGTGTACSQANPCGIATAINQAPNHATIHVASGEFGQPVTPIHSVITDHGNSLTIDGLEGAGHPILVSDATPAVELTGATRLSWLGIEAYGTAGILLDNNLAAADHLDVDMAAGNTGESACRIHGELTDSRCATFATDGDAIADQASAGGAVTQNVTLIGDTAVASGPGDAYGLSYEADHHVTYALSVTNSILYGTKNDIVARNPESTGAVHVALSYSDYNSVLRSKTRASVTKIGTNHNIGALPKFTNVDLGEDDELASSPTVDAGKVLSTSAQDLALSSFPRYINTAPDMGAFELPVAPTIGPPKIIKLTYHSMTATAPVNGHGMPVDVELRTTPSGGSTSVGSSVDPGIVRTPTTVTITSATLTPNTSYQVTAYANGQGGQTTSSAITVTTPVPFKGVSITNHHAKLTHHKVKVDLKCPTQTTAGCAGLVTLKRSGHGTVGKAKFVTLPGHATTVKVHVNKATRKAIANHGHLRLKAKASAYDGADQHKSSHRTIRVTD